MLVQLLIPIRVSIIQLALYNYACINVVFTIDNDGVIASQMVLDRESVNNYTLIITATDGGMPQPRSATANVTILINDENDNSPRFTSGAVLSGTPLTVPEVS